MMDLADVDQRLVSIGKQLEKNLDDWEAWSAKADIICSLGMYEIAIRCCDKSLRLNPANVLALRTKYIALNKVGKHEEADEVFARVMELGYQIDKPGSDV